MEVRDHAGNGVEKGAYGLPWYVNDGPTYWNTELMQKCGLDPNKIPATWDEYFAAGDTIVQNCKDVYLGTTMGYNAEDSDDRRRQVLHERGSQQVHLQ